jgi:CheY-like chemotaxis protein
MGVVLVFRDVSDRKEAAATRERYVRAQAANEAKDEFLAVLSHELRTPLNAMRGWVSLLRKQGDQPEIVARAIDVLERNVTAQTTLINDLLDVSRIVSGKLTVEDEPFDLTATAAASLDRVQPEAETKGLIIARAGLDAPRPVRGDPLRLARALHNVLHNAIKFTPSGGRIEVEARAVPDGHEIVVRDTGEGIAPDLLPRVFDRFWQADSAKTRRHGGLGLGLAIARHLLEAQGGTLAAASPGLGRGATFTLGLRAVADLPATPTRSASPPPLSLAGLRVLLVEDDEAMSDALTALLEHHGAAVTAAASARTALGLLAGAPPDIVVSDIGMPGESGYALIREIRAREAAGSRRVPALAMTGFASPEDRDEARAAGFDDHVPKPVDADTLIAHIRRMTGGTPS